MKDKFEQRMYVFNQTPRSPEYQRGFEDGYIVAKQHILDQVNKMQPVTTQTFTCTGDVVNDDYKSEGGR